MGRPEPTWEAMSAPTATKPNWPSDTWPDHPVSTVSDRAMTPKMQIWDMRKEWPTPMTKGSSATTTRLTHHAGAAHPLAQGVAGGAEGGRAHGPRRPLPDPGPLLQRGGPHEQRGQQEQEEDELDGGRSGGRVGDVPLQQVEDHPHPDTGDEGHREAHHAADEGGQKSEEQKVGTEHLGEGAGLAGRGQHGGDGRQGAGQGPGHRRGPAHPHPRQPGRLGVLGRGPHGQAPRATAG